MASKEFEAFWEFYMSVHRDPWTRRFHAAATLIGASCWLIAFPLTLDPRFLVLGPVLGYPIAWFSHFAFEHKPPAMFAGPVWALVCDLRMVRLMVQGRLDEVSAPRAAESSPAPLRAPVRGGSA